MESAFETQVIYEFKAISGQMSLQARELEAADRVRNIFMKRGKIFKRLYSMKRQARQEKWDQLLNSRSYRNSRQ